MQAPPLMTCMRRIQSCDGPVQGRLLRELEGFVGSTQPAHLPGFTQRAQDFQEGVQALVYDVLMLKVLYAKLRLTLCKAKTTCRLGACSSCILLHI